MKNPYIYGYLPLITIILFSLTFGLYTVTESIEIFKKIGVYTGVREFLSEIQLRVFLLIVIATIYFMIFSALKLIGETIHDMGMLFFSKDIEGKGVFALKGGSVIFFFGSLLSAIGITNIYILAAIFVVTIFIYFVFVIYKISVHVSFGASVGVMLFEMVTWVVIITLVVYAFFKLYNGIVSSLPFN
ncbi:DUF5366 family protein [Kurthia sibirica]|uniref:YufK family protein n=1 Tax=Kurthia sibirica TaxID=202750 RepID=A0A2U3AI23_9BACL|nr:DUF5366 family protein [Kurthia sibirica]PWI24157.1 hypothetical protein DEX24_14935 [Kurthia sibirica]GEK34681.1 hypothetical protein KSI01_22140 [Kurthia sibirica]